MSVVLYCTKSSVAPEEMLAPWEISSMPEVKIEQIISVSDYEGTVKLHKSAIL